MIRNLATLAADLRGYNSGLLRARTAYAEDTARVRRCGKCGTYRPIGGRCAACDAEKTRRHRARKEGQ